tara:strand:- start:276 stop:461 length:186 start_codon:yes stop_codon:yes gene_type:complete
MLLVASPVANKLKKNWNYCDEAYTTITFVLIKMLSKLQKLFLELFKGNTLNFVNYEGLESN